MSIFANNVSFIIEDFCGVVKKRNGPWKNANSPFSLLYIFSIIGLNS